MAKYLKGKGNPNANIMFLMESPSSAEVKAQSPFMGKILKEMFNVYMPLANLSPNMIYTDHVFQWVIPYKPTQRKAYIAEHWEEARKDTQFRVLTSECQYIIPMGPTATRVFFGYNLDRIHGMPHKWDGKVVIPFISPHLALNSPSYMKYLVNDFKALRMALRGKLGVFRVNEEPTDYREGFWLPDNPHPDLVGIDTEWDTQDKLWCVQASVKPGTAMVLFTQTDWDKLSEYLEGKLAIIQNAKADLSRLTEAGIAYDGWIDTMIISYALQDQSQGLKDLSYQFLSIIMGEYKKVVEPSTIARAEEYLGKVVDATWPDPPQEKEWRKEPQMEYEQVTTVLPCTKRKKGAFKENGEYFYIKTKRGEEYVVKGTENGYWHTKNPTNISKKVEGLVNRNDPKDYFSKWGAIKEAYRKPVEDKLGKLKMGDLSEIDRNQAITYAGMDADCTLQLGPILAQMYEDRGMVMTDNMWRLLI